MPINWYHSLLIKKKCKNMSHPHKRTKFKSQEKLIRSMRRQNYNINCCFVWSLCPWLRYDLLEVLDTLEMSSEIHKHKILKYFITILLKLMSVVNWRNNILLFHIWVWPNFFSLTISVFSPFNEICALKKVIQTYKTTVRFKLLKD